MTTTELTGWFPADVKPVYAGFYETALDLYGIKYGYSYFDGDQWFGQYEEFNYAVELSMKCGLPYAMQDKQWRGLASNPGIVVPKEYSEIDTHTHWQTTIEVTTAADAILDDIIADKSPSRLKRFGAWFRHAVGLPE
jgi:hypothetical protein